jgi:SAM-dependent methyltransferase
MSATASGWIPRRRILATVGLALGSALAALVGCLVSPAALVLLVPALGAGWAAYVMLRIRWQLSTGGGGWERRIHELVLDRLSLPADSQASVLDIGCGDASMLIALVEQAPGIRVTGVDLWGADWGYARSACETRLANLGARATFRRMDAASLDLPDGGFDAVVSVMCFHEVRPPVASRACGPLVALSEALRVLRPGGTFVLVDRFGDAVAFGGADELAGVLRATTGLRREWLVGTLGVPWPLSTRRALGPVEVLGGQKARRDGLTASIDAPLEGQVLG